MKISNEDVLVVVDVQHDFCPGGALAVPNGDEVVPKLNAIMPKFRYCNSHSRLASAKPYIV